MKRSKSKEIYNDSDSLKKEIKKLNKELIFKETHISNIKTENANLRNENSRISKLLSKHESLIKTLRSSQTKTSDDLKFKDSELERLKKYISKLERSILDPKKDNPTPCNCELEITTLNEKLKLMKSMLALNLQEVGYEIRDETIEKCLRKKEVETENNIPSSNLQREIEELKVTLHNKGVECQAYEDAFSEQREANLKLQTQFQDLNSLQKSISSRSEEIVILQKQLLASENEITKLENENKRLNSIIEEVRKLKNGRKFQDFDEIKAAILKARDTESLILQSIESFAHKVLEEKVS